MSNLIKYPFVNMQGKEKVVIGYEKDDKFVPLNKSGMEVVQAAEIDSLQEDRDARAEKESGDEQAKKKEEAEQQAEWVLSEAREQADRIREEAEREAESIRQAAKEEGMHMGREEGLAAAEEELEQIRAGLEASRRTLEQENARMASEMEIRYVDILCDLLRKLTGVLLRDKKDVLLHLIRSSFADIQPSNHYTLRVSSEDLTLVENHLDEILMNVEDGISINVREETGLARNDCIIETDTQMIDCGFRTQLDNLIMTLHMLVQ